MGDEFVKSGTHATCLCGDADGIMQLVGVGFHTDASVADVEIGDHLSVRAI